MTVKCTQCGAMTADGCICGWIPRGVSQAPSWCPECARLRAELDSLKQDLVIEVSAKVLAEGLLDKVEKELDLLRVTLNAENDRLERNEKLEDENKRLREALEKNIEQCSKTYKWIGHKCDAQITCDAVVQRSRQALGKEIKEA